MKPLSFEVEWVGEIHGQRLVLARQIDEGAFQQHDGLKLGGHRVLGFDMPRKLAPDGSLRLDLFGFTLYSDAGQDLRAGLLVELTGTR